MSSSSSHCSSADGAVLARTTSNPSTSKGQIQLIMGPMFSGKSTELIRRLKRYQIARYECLIAVSASALDGLRERAENYDVIGIDEGQFFPDVTAFCEDMANQGKIVLVAALDGTFQRKGFQSILDLVPLAEHVIKLKAVCMSCFGEGSFTKRLSEDTEVEVIGGAEKYMATCRRCYFSPATIPASPRLPLKRLDENVPAEENAIPTKKLLFTEKVH